ncbi:Putative polyol transporter 2 [Seminavis robusta]|uniref:Hexose transporter 1 n=1 Tax=Seminavis robusta TaxID=568900 RepID=A0A9N8HN30_9STRA|nr:Putative polyol transporter 2 [Seminavis robusta]|eukprot:Sro1050_g235460.1 Putative polyol transporter 2 (543) ;mRNA; f:4306-6138
MASTEMTPVPPNVETPSSSRPTLKQSHEGEHHGDYGGQEIPLLQATKVFALCAAVNSCNLGFDIGVSTSVGQLIQEDFELSDVQREIFVGSLNFFAMFGAFASNYFSDSYGRRQTFIIAAIGFIFGIIIMSLAPNFGILIFGRVFVGLGVGVGMAVDPVYISEISPAKHRGRLVTWSEIAINAGIVLGFSMGIFFADINTGAQWRIMLAMGMILPSVMIFLVINVMPESPRWFVSQGMEAEAKTVLEQVYPPNYPVTEIVDDIKEALERERIAEQTLGWSVICSPTPAFRRMLIVGIGTAVAQQAVGIDALQYYLTDVLETSGVESNRMQSFIMVILGGVKLAVIFVSGSLFDTRGRRPLFFASLLGMAVALLALSIIYWTSDNDNPNAVLLTIVIAIYLACFSFGMGPGAWLVPSEVFATSIRAKAMSIATTLNRATACLMSSTFLSTKNTLTWAGFFLLMVFVCLIVCVFLYFYLPETKGRSLEDMSVYFAEITGDTSILEAEKKLRGDEAQAVLDGAETPTGNAAEQEASATQEGGTLT